MNYKTETRIRAPAHHNYKRVALSVRGEFGRSSSGFPPFRLPKRAPNLPTPGSKVNNSSRRAPTVLAARFRDVLATMRIGPRGIDFAGLACRGLNRDRLGFTEIEILLAADSKKSSAPAIVLDADDADFWDEALN